MNKKILLLTIGFLSSDQLSAMLQSSFYIDSGASFLIVRTAQRLGQTKIAVATTNALLPTQPLDSESIKNWLTQAQVALDAARGFLDANDCASMDIQCAKSDKLCRQTTDLCRTALRAQLPEEPYTKALETLQEIMEIEE